MASSLTNRIINPSEISGSPKTVRARVRVSIVLAVAPLLLTGCGNADHRALEQMIQERVGRDGYVSVSDIAVYRDGDAKRGCLVVQRRNNWGEALLPERVLPWYNWNSQRWEFDNFYPIRDNRSCQDIAAVTPAQRAAAMERQREQERSSMNQQIETFLQQDAARIDAGTQAMEAQAKAVQDAADMGSAAAERELADQVAQEEAARDAEAARQDAERDRRVRESQLDQR
jgi:hypothetical protein